MSRSRQRLVDRPIPTLPNERSIFDDYAHLCIPHPMTDNGCLCICDELLSPNNPQQEIIYVPRSDDE